MVQVANEKLKKKMSMDGSVLKFMYSAAGAGKGLVAAGLMLVPIGVLLAVALFSVLGAQKALTIGIVVAFPGILLCIIGRSMQQRRMAGWVKAVSEATGLSEAEIHEVDAEFKEPGTVLLSFDKDKDTNSLKRMGFITTHYVKFPAVSPVIFRMQDMVACFYTERFLCQDGGYDKALIAYGSDKNMGYYADDPGKKVALEIVGAVEMRNPMVFTAHHFTYEGKEYDAARGLDDVIALHLEMRRQQAEQAETE